MVNFSHLKAFYEVAKNKSFTLAASELSVSQPTISMQVQALEKYYNVPLLKRTKKGIELTAPGQKTFSLAQKIFSISDDLDKYLIEIDQFKCKRHVNHTQSVKTRFTCPSAIFQGSSAS